MRPREQHDPQSVLHALQSAREAKGGRITLAECRKRLYGLPDYRQVVRLHGSWRVAMERAELEVSPRGRKPTQ